MTVELVAMAPWGDGVIVRRATGDLYLRMPEGAPGSRSVTDSDVAEAVAQHGYLLVNEAFSDMAAVQERIREIVASNPPPPITPRTVDASDVWRFVPSLVELAADPATAGEAHDCALRYLSLESVKADKALLDKLLQLLRPAQPESGRVVAKSDSPFVQRWSELAVA
jgi:hypothetical protein